METELVSEIARQIVRQEILGNWLYWLMLLLVSGLAGMLGSWGSSYAATTAKLKAINDKFDEILAQQSKSTRATEDIRSAVALGEWSKKEQIGLRRTKLEELLINAHKSTDWYDRKKNEMLFDGPKVTDMSPMPTIEAIGTLYFTELSNELTDFRIKAHELDVALLSGVGKILTAKRAALINGEAAAIREGQNALPGAAQEYTDAWKPYYTAVQALQRSAANLMSEIIAVR